MVLTIFLTAEQGTARIKRSSAIQNKMSEGTVICTAKYTHTKSKKVYTTVFPRK